MAGPAWSLWPLVLVMIVLGLTDRVQSQGAFVVAPNTFRLGAAETVAVYSHSDVQDVTVSLADYPGKKKIFFTQKLRVKNDEPQKLEVMVKPEHISDLNITGELDHHYVFLMVNSGAKLKEYKILVTLHSGYLFIQTDKPIYTPKQQVNMRLIRLNEHMLVDNETFTLQIRNPQNTIVDSRPSSDLVKQNGMYNYAFKFPGYSLLGEWSVTVLYGLKVKLNSTVTFELREYVLPTFQVKVEAPDVLFPDSEMVEISAKAQYVYGKNVAGHATFVLKVKLATGHTEHFGNCERKELVEGKATCVISTTDIKNKRKIGWFPGINGAKLLVEAIVFEAASGAKENGTTDVTIFSTTPYIISFEKSLSDFRPGIDAVVLAQVKHVHGKPASGVAVNIRVKDNSNNIVPVKNPSGRSNDEGLVAFIFETNIAYKSLTATIETDGQLHPSQGTHILFPYKSPENGAYVGISKDNSLIYKVGDTVTRSIYTLPKNMQSPISYLVVSKGKILATGSNWPVKSVQRSLSFKVTPDMVPSARLLIFAAHGKNLLTDSLKFRVVKVCRPNGLITLDAETSRKPGETVHLKVKGQPNTMVGILAVDQAVYALRNKDKLTSDKMFNEMESHDLGCGPGGGIDSTAVLANAGVVIIADTDPLDGERKSCLERKLKKRATSEEITRQHGQANQKCCKLGKLRDQFKRTCEERAEIIRRFEGTDLEDKEDCASVYLKCCQEFNQGRQDVVDADELDFPSDEELEILEKDIRERKDFRETWLFDSGVIGPNGILEQMRDLPDSITTWVVQAVGLSGKGGGMCVAEPKEIVAFQDVFMDVKMPYNVVKNEQIEIPVTVFNYGTKKLKMLVSTFGVEGLCSEAEPGKKGTPKKIEVNASSAVTVAFQMIPLEVKDYSLKFSAFSSGGSDQVIKTLSVIPEGVEHEEFFPFVVDPSNTEKRKRRNIVSDKYEARFDTENKKQLSIVKLTPEKEFVVPGTEYAVVEGIGDKFGTPVETSLNNPEGFLKLPHGCGEQNMAYMAPTVYAFHYLKATGKVTPQQETNAYKYIREGYSKQLTYRKAADGSFTVWPTKPSSTWLTAFVARVFCQAGKYVFIDDNVVCGALNWLVSRQNPDGTFVEKYMLHHKEMNGGVNGHVPLTAFVMMSFQQCQCNNVNLKSPKEKAINYLRGKVPEINDHYRMAIITYALALYDTEMAIEANEKLLQMSSYDPAANTRFWGDGNSAISVESSSYALLAQILLNDIDKATSIVNWLNGQRRIGGSFWSTQDTVIAIEALAEYAILAKEPDFSLVLNISSTSDPNFKHTWQFNPDNARVKRQIELNKIGGKLIVEAQGSGSGLFGVRMRYNIANSPDSICKFDVSVGVSEAVQIIKPGRSRPKEHDDFGVPAKLVQDLGVLQKPPKFPKNESQPVLGIADNLPPVLPGGRNLIKPITNDDLGIDLNDDLFDDLKDEPPKLIHKRDLKAVINRRLERAAGVPKSTGMILKITICAKYLGEGETNMAIVDVGMLTGYEANEDDLKNLVRDKSQTVDRFEKNGRNLIFYLEKLSSNEKTCFSFHINRKFLVSNLEQGLVRVYDYYEPKQACSQFYRPTTVGPALGTVCFEKKIAPGAEFVYRVCQCAEGGCPPEKPYEAIFSSKTLGRAREMLAGLACNEKDYFWRVQVVSRKEEKSGYTQYKMQVIKVIKEGLEKRDEVEDDEREFLARGNCHQTVLDQDKIYYIMGRDPEPREVDGEVKYTYLIDKSTLIRPWIDIKNKGALKAERRRQSDIFSFIERSFENQEACND